MRQAALGIASVLLLAVFAGCTAGTKDNGQDVSTNSVSTIPTMGDMPGMGQVTGAMTTLFPKMPTLLTVSGAAWLAPGTMLDATVTPPVWATGAISYTWAYGPVGGTVPIAQLKKSATASIEPGHSESITFDEAGVFYEHCHPHPWMRSNVTILDSGRTPVTTTVHFVDGATPADFHFTPENLVLPLVSTVVYQND